MLKKGTLLYIFLIALINISLAQNKIKLFRAEGQKDIDVSYVKFDTSAKLFFYTTSFKQYAKMQGEELNEKNINRWNKSTSFKVSEVGKKPDAEKLDYALTKVLKESGFIDTVNQIFKNEGNIIYLQPVIGEEHYYRIEDVPLQQEKKIKVNIHKCKINVNWKISNVFGEILDSVMLTTETNQFDTISYFSLSMMEIFFTQAVIELLADKKLQKYFIKTNTNLKPPLSTLNKPTSVISLATEAQTASVIVKTTKGHGSGFAITNDGYIITNYHVISTTNPNKVEEITIILLGGTKLKGNFIKANKDKDIALIKVETNFEKCFLIPTEKNFKVFDEIYAMGAPKSIELGQSASKGILSSERNVNNTSLLQVSMNINSGNSGGPMFNTNGKLVGVVSAKLFGFGIEGVAFGIPAYKINDYLNIEFK